MAKQEVTPLRSIRLTNERGEGGRAVGGARTVITDADEMSKGLLKRLAEKGDVAGMDAAPATAEEEAVPKSTKKSGK